MKLILLINYVLTNLEILTNVCVTCIFAWMRINWN